jgi:hypothetical protein
MNLLLILAAFAVADTHKALIGHWTFDEPPAGYERVEGVFGGAVNFKGRHRLQCDPQPVFGTMAKISFSAWVRPKAFDRYNEIFRKEDGDHRVLFSFQENGRILSLGLNIGGYIECDAPLDPKQVLDGHWHHAAATFDGKTMRVYLDGAEIGALERPGVITAGGAAKACIGSSNGGECFQGAMDDLCIYADALTVADIALLAGVNLDSMKNQLRRQLDLLLEYRPLTDEQWKRQTPAEIEKWKEADQLQKRFEKLQTAQDAAQLLHDLRERVQLRPSVQEAVAPYVKPETPVTRTLSAAEGRAALERDWLFQAGGEAQPEQIRNEILWTRQLAARLKVDCPSELEGLSGTDRERYFRIRELKRRIMFRNPSLNFAKVLLVDMPFPAGKEWKHETRHRLGYMAVPGARLLVLDGLRPDGNVRQLMPQSPLHGSFWRPEVSFDGRKVLFCFKPHNEKSFHLYEINTDGTGLRQLTDGPFDDLDPIYLPDGHILFTSTRGHTYVRCMPPTNAYVLSRCDPDGRNIYLISSNNEPDYLPSVLHDGRVIYTRWEYTDKPLWRAQKLWTINPDGSYISMFWGNQSVWPDVVKDARAIPGSRRVMVTGSAHHNWFAGSVAIIDTERGLNFPHGLTKVTADVPWPECGNGPVDPVESPRYHASGKFAAYYSPYPLSEEDFIVSAERDGKFLLYLMDVDGNRELLYEGVHNIFHAMPLQPRAKPPVLTDRVAWPARGATPETGVIFSGNVYENAPAELRGKAKLLRVFSIDHKTYTYWHKRPYISTGPVVSAVQSEGVKRLLGTVPIEADGSVAFHAPAGIPLHFQLLDERQRALQTMRSFVSVMPGEQRGCLGCHELHSRAPRSKPTSLTIRDIAPPPWNDVTVSYPRYVQPVLDKYCGRCHQGDGKARAKLDLTERPSTPVFTEPYWTLIGRPTWGKPYEKPEKPPPGFGIAGMIMVEAYDKVDPQAYVTPKPMTSLSYKSRLVEIASKCNYDGVKVDPISLQRLIVWVDAMCPYKGDEEVRAEDDPVFQGVEWLAIRPKIKTAPHITRPGPVD